MIEGNLLILRRPTINEGHYVRSIWENKETMKDVGGIVLLPEDKYVTWWKFMFEEKINENQYFLIFIKKETKCIGEVSFHRYDVATGKAMFNIKIMKNERRHKYGSEAMDLILDYYFSIWGGKVMEDSMWEKNIQGIEAMVKYGFIETRREKDEVWIQMDRLTWERRKEHITLAST